MRIHRITLRNYRGVERCEVVLPATGVTIVSGPNEVGKSSLAEAVDLLFDFPHDSRHRRVLDVRPVDRDVATEVEVELVAGPYHVVYGKRWFRQAATHLQVLAPRPERLTARQAHDRMTQILGETVDQVLYRALRIVQGEAVAPSGLDGSTTLVRALDAAAGGSADPAAESTLWEAVEAERSRYWTPTGRPSQARQQLVAQAAAAEAEAEAARRSLAELEAAGERARLVEAELVAARSAAVDAEQALAAAEAAAASVDAATHNLLQRRAELVVAERAETVARQAHLARQALVTAVGNRQADVDRLAAEVAAAAPVHQAAAEAADHLRDAHAAAEATCAEARRQVALAEADRQFRRAEAELGVLRDRQRRVALADDEAAAARRALASTVVEPADRPAVERAVRRLGEARAAQRAGTPELEVEALGDVVVTVDGQPVGAAGQGGRRSMTATTTIEVGELARVRVHLGATATQLAAEVAAAEADLGAFVDRLGLAAHDPLGSLGRALDSRRDAEQALAQAQRSRHEALGGAAAEALAAAVEQASRLVGGYLTRRAGEGPVPATADDAERAHAAAAEASLRAEAAEQALRRQLAAADADVRERRVAVETSTRLHREQRDQLSAAEGTLAAARAERPDTDLADALVGAAEAADKARAVVAEADAYRTALEPAATAERLVTARRRVEDLDRRRHELEAAAVELRTTLREQGRADLQAVAQARSAEAEQLAAERDDLERRAAAADLLHRTLDRQRRATRQAYAAPYRSHLERLARLVFGPDTVVDVDPADLSVTSRTCGGATVPVDALSTGAREQLAVLSRLAVAAVVGGDPEAGVPVVLDDALGCTDADRLHRMAPAFAAAAGTQVIVMTSHPERYRSLTEATVVQLPSPLGAGGG